MTAYGHSCAVTDTQLELVEAAHILPVNAEGSTDLVTNGIPLMANYHRAFDAGLIYLTEDFVMRVNRERLRKLRRDDLDGGFEVFEGTLGPITRPVRRRDWPDPEMIRLANTARRIRV